MFLLSVFAYASRVRSESGIGVTKEEAKNAARERAIAKYGDRITNWGEFSCSGTSGPPSSHTTYPKPAQHYVCTVQITTSE
jgi:hypothetical protein